MNELDIIAQYHGTDKSSKWHNYTTHYYGYFLPLRDKKIRLLEIGVGKGKSLRMWGEFFPNAELFAIDINPKVSKYVDERVTLFIGDQTDSKFLHSVAKKVKGKWDVIIDDGGHYMRQQIASFEILFPYLNPKGIYVIEDLHTSYLKDFSGGFRKAGTTVEFLKNLLDEVNKRGVSSCGDPVKVLQGVKGRGKLGIEEFAQLPKLSKYALWIDSMHFYLGLCFIFKSK